MAPTIELRLSSPLEYRSHGEQRVEIGDWLRDLGLERYAEAEVFFG